MNSFMNTHTHTHTHNTPCHQVFSKTEIAGPGFINAYLNPQWVAAQVYSVVKWFSVFSSVSSSISRSISGFINAYLNPQWVVAEAPILKSIWYRE